MNPEIPSNCLPAELVARPGFLLARLGTTLKTQTMDAFENEGYSAYHYSILALLEEGARTTQAGVADALGLDASMLVSLLDGLEDRGFIERKRDPNDRRRQTVTVTAAGRRQLAVFRKLVLRIEEEFLAPLTDAERQELHDLLLRVGAHRDARFVVRTVARA